jgi:hypothetical protein
MNTALWIIAAVLAAAFLAAGGMKLITPRAKLQEKMAWVEGATDGQVKLVGLVEVLGAIGLVVPAAVDIAPILVPFAAVGLALTMAGAVAVHVRGKEPAAAMVPAIVLGALSVLVAVMRFGPEAF